MCDNCSISLGTSVFAGIATFSILGHMAYVSGNPVETVLKDGQIPIHHHLLFKNAKILLPNLYSRLISSLVQDLALHLLCIQML